MLRRRRPIISAGVLLGTATTAVIIAAAWIYTENTESYAFVPLSDMLTKFHDVWFSHQFVTDALPSFKRLALGYGVSIVIGATGGFLLGMSPTLRIMFHPAINFFRAIPPIALIPAALFVFGIGDQLQIFIIALVCIWPVLLNVADGVAEVDETLISTAKSYRIDGIERFRHVLFRAVTPRLAAGMRQSLSFAILLLVSSEMLAATTGIGAFVMTAQQTFRPDNMWAGIILLGLIGVVVNAVFAAIERRALHWHYRGDYN